MTNEELTALDLEVAKAEGIQYERVGTWGIVGYYTPTRDPAEAMRLLERYRLSLECDYGSAPENDEWLVTRALGPKMVHEVYERAKTPCIAICKAVIALRKT